MHLQSMYFQINQLLGVLKKIKTKKISTKSKIFENKQNKPKKKTKQTKQAKKTNKKLNL